MAASSIPAIADKENSVAILSFADSPVALDKCEAWARHANKTYLYTHVSVQNHFFDLGIAFTNTSGKAITAVRVELTSYDSFNTLLRSGDFDTQDNRSADKMSVAPGASVDLLGPRSWPRLDGVSNRDHVSCAITAVRLQMVRPGPQNRRNLHVRPLRQHRHGNLLQQNPVRQASRRNLEPWIPMLHPISLATQTGNSED
jgi:hypothetical protein